MFKPGILLCVVAVAALSFSLSGISFGDPEPVAAIGTGLPALKDLPLAHAFNGFFRSISVSNP